MMNGYHGCIFGCHDNQGKNSQFFNVKILSILYLESIVDISSFPKLFCFGCIYHRTQIIARQRDPLFRFMKTPGIPVSPHKTWVRSRILKILFLLPRIYTKLSFFTPMDAVVEENWCLGIPTCSSPWPLGLGRGYRGFQFGKTVRRIDPVVLNKNHKKVTGNLKYCCHTWHGVFGITGFSFSLTFQLKLNLNFQDQGYLGPKLCVLSHFSVYAKFAGLAEHVRQIFKMSFEIYKTKVSISCLIILIFLTIHCNSTTILALSEVQPPLSRILNEMVTDSWSWQ